MILGIVHRLKHPRDKPVLVDFPRQIHPPRLDNRQQRIGQRRRIFGHQSGPIRCNHIANRVALKASEFPGEIVVRSVARQVFSGISEFIGHGAAG
jgi:hypothetical protein